MRTLDRFRFLALALKATDRLWLAVDKSGGPEACWPYTGTKDRKGGYGTFRLTNLIWAKAHRVAFAVSNGAIPQGAHVLHRCDNPPCCNPAHLFTGTHQDNMADMRVKGRYYVPPPAIGEDNARAKLTSDQVAFIKRMILSGMTNKAIAGKFGVTHSMISRIRRGKAWGTVSMQEPYEHMRRKSP